MRYQFLLARPRTPGGFVWLFKEISRPSATIRLLYRPMATIGVAIVGCGGITLQNHLPGLALCPNTRVVALCDTDAATLQKASQQTGIKATSARYEEIVGRDDVHAVIIATPNVTHAP